MANPWFRMYSEAVDDEKLRLLAFEDRWHFVALLCLKCSGVLEAADNVQIFRRKIGVKLGLQQVELESLEKRLLEVGLIGKDFHPIAWDKRQFKSDKDNSTERQRRYRAKKQMVTECNASLTRDKRVTVADVTRLDTDTDTDTERSKTIAQNASAFARFWLAYPKKKSKGTAESAWKKIKPNEQLAGDIVAGVERAKMSADWTQDGGKYIPHPATWLNAKGWEDHAGALNGESASPIGSKAWLDQERAAGRCL